MKFKYVGNCEKGEVNCFGITFKKGEPVEVNDEKTIFKLRNNDHFKEVEAKKPRKSKKEQSVSEVAPEESDDSVESTESE